MLPVGETSAWGSRGPPTADPAISAPPVSLPKGGGAIRGIGEKLSANPVTGTGNVVIPIAASPGRSGFGPHLALSYDSGAGNGPFGLGWSLSLPAITRKTDKGLPRYLDPGPVTKTGQDIEADVFLLSGAEDLVPELTRTGTTWHRVEVPRSLDGVDYSVSTYRPRTEGLFARIERWVATATDETHWRSISRDNVTTLYGPDAGSRIADSARPDPRHTFSWLAAQSWDDRGNWIVYDYLRENSAGVAVDELNEANRTDRSRSANRYPKRIRYGNRVPRLTQPDPSQADWMFEVVFDYGEHDAQVPRPNDAGAWLCRRDPFSSCRAGFEIRTYRLCQRVLMFHHFPADPAIGTDCLVRSTRFRYHGDAATGDSVVSLLAAVTQAGHVRRGVSYAASSLPDVEFDYSEPQFDGEVHELGPDAAQHLPRGLDGSDYRWLDLDGEGVSGVLAARSGSWSYSQNLGAGRFAPARPLARRPATADLQSGQGRLLDLASDGRLDVVTLDGPTPGFFERTRDADWSAHTAFESAPAIAWSDPDLRFMDLTGDGLADVLITQNDALVWYASLGKAGFADGGTVVRSLDEEAGPRLLFADGEESVFLADMSGDGLTDLVRVRNGAVCYWPNVGYGRFAAKITMPGLPGLDRPDLFDARRVRLVDVDGSGTTDLIYLGSDGARLYPNEAGNRWGRPTLLAAVPSPVQTASVQAADLLGTGTGCVVWSSPLPGDVRTPIRYVDLLGGTKPYLLVGMRNNLGAETRLHYTSSTQQYLADQAAGQPWVTRLPFPVHVVDRVEARDHLSGNRFVSTYSYHHGYFDGLEREFRGFGRVDQLDTEELGVLLASGAPAGNDEAATYVPPALHRTWFHTGASPEADMISSLFAAEYYHEDDPNRHEPGPARVGLSAMLLADTVLPETLRMPDGTRPPWPLTDQEEREARRALRGLVLREEVYALDGTEKAGRPYRIAERNYTVEMLQPCADRNRHAVFFTHQRESVEFDYERSLYGTTGHLYADPRVTHTLTLEVDVWGNVQRTASISYGRRVPDPDPLLTEDDHAQQRLPLLTSSETRYTAAVQLADSYRAPLPCETRTFELLQISPAASGMDGTGRHVTPLFGLEELRGRLDQAAAPDRELPFEDVEHRGLATAQPYRRLIEHRRVLYRKDDLTGLLPLGDLDPRALPGESYQLAFTPGLLADVYHRDGQDLLPADPADVLITGGGYVRLPGSAGWWVPSGRSYFHPGGPLAPAGEAVFGAEELAFAEANFYLPHRFVDPFGHATSVAYDSPHLLQVTESVDPAGNVVRSGYDYRVLAVDQVTDPNGNRSAVVFDRAGLVAATAVMGKPGDGLGDSLASFTADPQSADPELPALQAFTADPHGQAATLLGTATTRVVYDLHRFARCGQPPFAAVLAREQHADTGDHPGAGIHFAFVYSDGFGRELQSKIQAEPGVAPRRDRDLPLPTGDIRPGPLLGDTAAAARRWVGQGRTVYDNKGRPVKQYEPFFSATHLCEQEQEVTDTGVASVLFRDPVGRVVATLHPDDTYGKVVFDPWRQATWDANDTVALDPRTDPDVAALVQGHFAAQLPGWQTWYARRSAGGHGETPDDRAVAEDAARKALAHAATPARSFSDSLGRPFATIADNGPEGAFTTRVARDIEGNPRVITDARGIAVTVTEFDMLGRPLHSRSPDAGERWTLPDATGALLRSWDTRGNDRRLTYDPLHRPLDEYITGGGAASERLAQRTIYGEAAGGPGNHKGRVYQVFDDAGVITNDAYDFKGNLLRSTRRVRRDYRTEAAWPADPGADVEALLEPESFTCLTFYDAFDRPVQVVAPHSGAAGTTISVARPGYNEAKLLERVDAWLEQPAEPVTLLAPVTASQPVVANIDYDARGQRILVEYGNGVRTMYNYDPLTFRLRQLTTRRAADVLQDLRYEYDPVGNVTSIRDAANDRIFHNQQVVDPGAEYRYDALYRLAAARGREHRAGDAQVAADAGPWTVSTLPNDGQALRNYVETYVYDSVGNVLAVRHHEGFNLDAPGKIVWHRRYQYALDGNRLLATSLPGDQADAPPYAATAGYSATYTHDPHGNMTAMPHLTAMIWDQRDQLRGVELAGGSKAFYTYDAAGQRVRKVWEKDAGLVEERIYLGGFEIFRRRKADTLTLERQTLHLMDGERRVAMIENRTRVTGADPAPQRLVRFQHGNHLGSAVLELDAAAKVISYEEYHPYGSTAYCAVRSQTETPKRYRYTGKERDEESGFSYHGARYYIAWLARWASPDPSGTSNGPNIFAYVCGNPVKLVDITGKEGTAPDQGIISGFFGKLWERANTPTEAQAAFKEGRYGDFARKLVIDAALASNPIISETVADYHLAREAIRIPGQIGDAVTAPRDDDAGKKMADAFVTFAALAMRVAGPMAKGVLRRPAPEGASSASPHSVAAKPKPAPPASEPPAAKPPTAPIEPPAPPSPTPAGDPFASLGPPTGGDLSQGVPWIDAGSVKPASAKWTAKGGSSAWSDLEAHIAQLPDSATQAVAFYDAAGNVFLMVKRVGGMQELIWSGPIGKVPVSGLPGEFGVKGRPGSMFGNAIEGPINDLISSATHQPHVLKHASETGLDFTPQVTRGRAIND
jgi:RHS repeat-associated protein